ncbi:UNC5C-like protein [Ptychodera flava]|uniref:UNC5C-like protein n=1 Tax=Ptychodera flava TaxID=63121 RepID=UPI00396A42E1
MGCSRSKEINSTEETTIPIITYMTDCRTQLKLDEEPVCKVDTIKPTDLDDPDDVSLRALGFFDEKGGHLTFDKAAVSLFIPPGALPNGREEKITMVISRQVPKHGYGACVSPCVVLGPSGLKFKKDVVLTYSHCAGYDSNSQTLIPISWKTDSGAQVECTDLRDDESASFFADDKKCTILLRHFTGFTTAATGGDGSVSQNNVKVMDAMVYLSRDGNVGKLRVRVINKTDDSMRMLEREEEDLGGHRTDAGRPLLLTTNGKDVTVEVKVQGNSWEIFPTSKKVLSYRRLYLCNNDTASFVVKRNNLHQSGSAESCHRFECEISLIQDDEPSQDIVTFVVSEEMVPSSAAVSIPPGDLNKSSVKEFTQSKAAFEFSEIQRLQVMDVPDPTGKDWRKFAEKILKMTHKQIKQLERQESPMSTLMDIWESGHINPSRADFKELYDFFRTIQRDDAADVIKDHIENNFTRETNSVSEEESDSTAADAEYLTSLENQFFAVAKHARTKVLQQTSVDDSGVGSSRASSAENRVYKKNE